jgi:hypothetical protein
MTDAATPSPPPGLFVRIKGGGMVVVPPSQQCLATYVLLEQEDWFEKEVGFVRRFLQPAMRVLDIGADYGAYTVAMARAIGPTGRLVAFESDAGIAEYLQQTIDGNALGHVSLRLTALGSTQTLDREHEASGLGHIDFVRLDAERTALDIVAGGARLFATGSPLVMFTARQETGLNTALLAAWSSRGYDLYRLIGPDTLLVPFRPDEPIDSFEINLFACKPDRAATLEAAGLLATGAEPPQGVVAGSGLTVWRQQTFASGFDHAGGTADLRLVRALDLYAAWRDETRPPAQRYAALTEALGLLETVVAAKPSTAHNAMLARLAFEAGKRERALDLIEPMMANERGKLPESPFWPVAPRFDGLRPGPEPGVWFAASLIEAFERLRANSGYFAPVLPLDRLAWLSKSPFASAEMERRRILLANRLGDRKATEPAAVVIRDSPDNLNFDLWAAI